MLVVLYTYFFFFRFVILSVFVFIDLSEITKYCWDTLNVSYADELDWSIWSASSIHGKQSQLVFMKIFTVLEWAKWIAHLRYSVPGHRNMMCVIWLISRNIVFFSIISAVIGIFSNAAALSTLHDFVWRSSVSFRFQQSNFSC